MNSLFRNKKRKYMYFCLVAMSTGLPTECVIVFRLEGRVQIVSPGTSIIVLGLINCVFSAMFVGYYVWLWP